MAGPVGGFFLAGPSSQAVLSASQELANRVICLIFRGQEAFLEPSLGEDLWSQRQALYTTMQGYPPLLPPPADARFLEALELLAGPDGPWSRGGVGQEGRWVFSELRLGRGQQVSLWRLPLLQAAFNGRPEYFPGTGLEEVEATGKGGHSLTSVVGQAWGCN